MSRAAKDWHNVTFNQTLRAKAVLGWKRERHNVLIMIIIMVIYSMH